MGILGSNHNSITKGMRVVIACLVIFGMLGGKGKLPSAKEIQDRVNARYDELFFKPEKGDAVPYVCVVCDSLIVGREELQHLTLNSLERAKKLFEWSRHERRRTTHEGIAG